MTSKHSLTYKSLLARGFSTHSLFPTKFHIRFYNGTRMVHRDGIGHRVTTFGGYVVKKPQDADVLVIAKTDGFSKEFKNVISDFMMTEWECTSYAIRKKVRDEIGRAKQTKTGKLNKKKIITDQKITLSELLSLLFLGWSNQKSFYIKRDKYRVFKDESTIENSFGATPYQKNYQNVLYLQELMTFEPNPDYNPKGPISPENPRLLVPKIGVDAPIFSSIFLTTTEKAFIESIAPSKLAAYNKLLAKKRNPKYKVKEEFELDNKFLLRKDDLYWEKMQHSDWAFYQIDKIGQELTGQKNEIPEVKDTIYFPSMIYINFDHLCQILKNNGAKIVRKQSFYRAIYPKKSSNDVKQSLKKGSKLKKTQKDIQEMETVDKESTNSTDDRRCSIATQEDISDEGTFSPQKVKSPLKKREGKSKRKANDEE